MVKQGQTFLRSLIDASSTVKVTGAPRPPVGTCQRGSGVVAYFVRALNGISLLPAAELSQTIYFDASGGWGFGAKWNHQWFQVPWPKDWAFMHISPKELVPIVIAVALWGPCCYCDNSGVVFAVNKGATRDPQLMRLMCALYFFCASYNVTI